MPEVDYFFLANNMQKNRQLSQQQQQIDMSRQRNDLLNEATRQEMSHLAQMNPLAVQARQFELEQAQAMGPLALRAAKLQNEGYSADNAAKVAESEFQEKTLQDRLDAVASGADLAQQQVVNAGLVPGQIEAQIGASNASASASNLAGQLTQDKRQALKSEQENAKGRQQTAQAIAAFDQYDKMKETNPEAAEEFKRQQFEASGLNPDTDIDQVRAAVDVQRNLLGEFKQVPGLPGMTFDERTGKYHAAPAAMEHALKMNQKSKAADSVLRGKDLQGVNDKVTTLIKEPAAIINSYNDLKALRGSNSSTDQLAAVFKFMKALDPTSVVREGEQGMVFSASGKAQQFSAMIQGLVNGEKLPDEAFDNLVGTAGTLADTSKKAADQAVKGYLDVMANEGSLTKKSYDDLMKRTPEVKLDKQKTNRIKISANEIESLMAPIDLNASIAPKPGV